MMLFAGGLRNYPNIQSRNSASKQKTKATAVIVLTEVEIQYAHVALVLRSYPLLRKALRTL